MLTIRVIWHGAARKAGQPAALTIWYFRQSFVPQVVELSQPLVARETLI